MVGQLDTKPGGENFPWIIRSDEAWELHYELMASNADPMRFDATIRVVNGAVVVSVIEARIA